MCKNAKHNRSTETASTEDIIKSYFSTKFTTNIVSSHHFWI
jgi:hypothetical protein